MNAITITEHVVELPDLVLAGLTAHFTPATTSDMASLWGRLAPHLGFEGQLGDGATYGVWLSRAADGAFDFLAGVQVAPQAAAPAALETRTLPASRYAVFRQPVQPGDLHAQMVAATEQIWSELLPRSGHTLAEAPDFQVYQANFAAQDGAWIDHFLPIRG